MRRLIATMKHSIVGIVMFLTLGLLAAPLPAEAQQAGKVYRIGYLGGAGPPKGTYLRNAFRQGLRELGYVEGQNILIEWRFLQGQYERLPGLVAELIRLPVEVIVAPNDRIIAAFKEATTTIPIVMVASHDPVGAGFVETLARPGGNITGLSAFHLDIGLKHLELLKEVLPGLTHVGYLFRLNELPLTALQVQRTQAAAPVLGLTLQSFMVSGPSELDHVFAAIARERPGALIGAAEPFIWLHQKAIAAFGLAHRLPIISYFKLDPQVFSG